ncbi:hypothetical protein G7Y79_00016g040620 [Physcia stellaris]|nr:hypothetical protein G7Y79_00016g040620 [Physcia stellaris]
MAPQNKGGKLQTLDSGGCYAIRSKRFRAKLGRKQVPTALVLAKHKRNAPVSGRTEQSRTRRNLMKALPMGDNAKPTKVVRLKVSSHALQNLIDRNAVTCMDGIDFNTLKEVRREKGTERTVSVPELNRREPPDKASMELPFLLEPDTLVTLMLFDNERFIPWFSDGLQNRAVTAVMDYLQHDNGRTFTTEQTLHIYYALRLKPRSAHPVDALTEMRGWLEAWHDFYRLKNDRTCINKIEELQAIVECGTNPTIIVNKRKEASNQLPGAIMGRGLNFNHSGSEIASTDTLMANGCGFEPQIQQKVAAHAFEDTHSPVSALNLQDTGMRAKRDMRQAIATIHDGDSQSGIPSLKAPNVTDTLNGFLGKAPCRESGVPLPRAAHPGSLVSRGLIDRSRVNLGEVAQEISLDTSSSLQHARVSGDRPLNGNGMSAGWESSDLFADMGHGRNQDLTDQRDRLGIAMRARTNSQHVAVVTSGVSNTQRAATRFQDMCPLPPGYINLEDPFGNIHKIGVDQQLQCVIEGLVATECCRSDPKKVRLVTNQRYELYTLAGSTLKPCIRIADIMSGDFVKMCFKA